MNDKQLSQVTRAVERAPRWRRTAHRMLYCAPVGMAANGLLWDLGVYSGAWWRPVAMAATCWLATALVCKVIERWYVRRINRILPGALGAGWKVTRVTSK